MNITSIVEWWTAVRIDRWWLVMGAGGAVLLAVLLAVRAVRARRARPRVAVGDTAAEAKISAGSGGFYTAAFMSLGLSVDTSWRFFEHEIGIENVVERVAMFSLLEVLLISCGLALRAQVRNPNGGVKGPYQAVAWALTGGSAFMALMVTDDLLIGLARVGFGPVAGLLALHLALGLDLRHTRPANASTGTAARIANELLQRGLSHLGLANDDRDAARLRADRHARQLAWMVIDGIPKDGDKRKKFDRALRLSNVAHDDLARTRLLAELAVLKHVDKLSDLALSSPWGAEVRTSDPGPSDPAEVRTSDPGPSDPGPSDPAEVRTSDPGPSDRLGSGPRTEQFPALTDSQVPAADDDVFAAAVEKGVQVYAGMVRAGQRPNQKTFTKAFRAGATLRNDDIPALWAAVRERASAALAAV